MLDEAKALSSPDATEARRRSAVSRCYLACYHHVSRHPAAAKVVDKVREHNSAKITAGKYSPGLHTLLVKALVKSADRNLIHIAGTMQALLRAQADADYDLEHHVGERAVEEAIRRAVSIFADLPA